LLAYNKNQNNISFEPKGVEDNKNSYSNINGRSNQGFKAEVKRNPALGESGENDEDKLKKSSGTSQKFTKTEPAPAIISSPSDFESETQTQVNEQASVDSKRKFKNSGVSNLLSSNSKANAKSSSNRKIIENQEDLSDNEKVFDNKRIINGVIEENSIENSFRERNSLDAVENKDIETSNVKKDDKVLKSSLDESSEETKKADKVISDDVSNSSIAVVDAKEKQNKYFQDSGNDRAGSIFYLKSKEGKSGFDIQPLLAALTFDSEYYSTRLSSSDDRKRQQRENMPFQSKLRISGQFSPDFSSVMKIELNRPSYNTGVSLEYFISNKFSVSLGILNSRKVYTAKSDAYSFSGPVYHKPDRIEGKCTVYDIPLNIKYYYASGRRFRNFVSTGISSYVMRKESYKYEYSNYTKTYDYPKGNNHLFSVINISIGGECQLTPRITVGLEPFLKIPTKGVGEGKIKLNTVGSFLSINYTIYKQ
jgi:hypothetical protein